jgi:hypothetical protein
MKTEKRIISELRHDVFLAFLWKMLPFPLLAYLFYTINFNLMVGVTIIIFVIVFIVEALDTKFCDEYEIEVKKRVNHEG